MSDLVVATSFPIHPALGGGQQRVQGLYGAAAREGVTVDVVALVPFGEREAAYEVMPGLREIRVPKTREHHDAEHELGAALSIPVTDVSLALHHELTPSYAAAVRTAADGARAVVACHPYAMSAIIAVGTGLPLLYEAQDVESDLKAAMLEAGGRRDTEEGVLVLKAVREVEAEACAQAELVLTCSDIDARRLDELFGLDEARAAVVPNGCHCELVPFTDYATRRANQAAVALDSPTVLFVGSWHGPNLAAARAVVDAAAALPDVRFLIVGGAGLALDEDELPPNVDATGPVSAPFLDSVLRIADLAVNPMDAGSGTNLKMLQYAAAGLPIVSTEFGARGLGFDAGEHYIAVNAGGLAAAIEMARSASLDETAGRVKRAHARVLEHFDWSAIARRWLRHPAMERILSR